MATKQTAARKRVSSVEAKRRQTQAEAEHRRQPKHYDDEHRRHREALTAQGFLTVIPFLEWCRLVGISKATGRRLVEDGAITITHLSTRRIGVRSDHHQQYLDRCSGGAVS